MLTLKTRNGQTRIEPGQTIEGRAGWKRDRAPSTAVVRLFWYTAGQGKRDVYIAEEERLRSRHASHEEGFVFEVPRWPCSFTGGLISLRWALELVVDGGEEVERIELQVTPWECETYLGTAPDIQTP